jgi:uncharacterized protein YkwD
MRHTIGVLSAALALLLAVRSGSAADDREKKEESKIVLTDDEKLIVELTNKERAKEGLPPLTINLTLCKVARGHSANMVKHGKMDHVLDGKKPADRADEGGYKWEVVAENLGTGEKRYTVPLLMKDWMESKVHRVNILHKEFTEIGVGIAQTDKGERYFTQVFAAPAKD